ncbi:zinc finger MYM-type protein 1-like isoform X1 [Metopolophium dirhodum]|uniref:zinc finger MYM-type protein 1-like isoform X1 n=1 Tax=Metopolophium dirhodum TaxID=44670 RepID=UPI00298FC59E|nr:zinc finger MYM-type protein 1-like isoform X1 [Metopolophium dirhodum]
MFSLFKKHTNVNLHDPSVSCSSGTSKNDIGVNDLGTLSTGPRRPVLASYKKSQFGKQLRSFRSQWFNDYEWLEYSIERNAAFCYVCRIFSTGNCTQDVWTHSGFDNWQKFGTKVNGHFSSKNHLTNVEKMNSYKKTKETGSVITQISSFHKEEVAKNRKYMSYLIEIVLYLAKQGISYRGHDEKCDSLNQGNFKELCNIVFSKFIPDFENFYNKKNSQTSWKVQEEIIGICADLVRETIIDNIVKTGHFALMVDEARSHKQEQLSVCIRYAVGLESHERFLQFVDVSSGQDANSIVAAIYQCFENLNISMNSLHIVAQSYDGASVMSGCLGGVQAKIKEKYPNAIYTHCMAHRLNLVVVDMCKGVKCARNIFNTLEMLYVHFSRPSNCSKLISIQSKLELRKGNVLRICDTRWVCRFKNCDAMIKNYPAILKFLINEVEEQNDKDAVEAIGILSQINNCNFLIGVTLLKDVLCIINMLSTTLQSKSATLGKAKETINGVIKSFEQLRCEDEFYKFWKKIELMAEEFNITLQINRLGSKRKRTQPKYLNNYHLQTVTADEEVEQNFSSVSDFWKITVYFPIIDTVIANLKYRFSEKNLSMACSVDNFMSLNYDGSQEFINHYKDILCVKIEVLKAEMMVINNCLPPNFTLEDLKDKVKKDSFPNLYKLLQIAITIPVSSATCERSFSTMRRTKNWLRSSMLQQRFTNLSLLNIEKDLLNQLNTETILNKYCMKPRKIMLI